MADENELQFDVDGFEVLTNALMDLVNSYPLLDGEVAFATLDAESGKALFPSSGAVIRLERESVTGHIHQECIYPFSIYYRAVGLSESRKISIKEWLDNLGRWLERQSITKNNVEYKINNYPQLTGGRVIEKITRTSPAYQGSVATDATEDWVISLQAEYTNDFERS